MIEGIGQVHNVQREENKRRTRIHKREDKKETMQREGVQPGYSKMKKGKNNFLSLLERTQKN